MPATAQFIASDDADTEMAMTLAAEEMGVGIEGMEVHWAARHAVDYETFVMNMTGIFEFTHQV